MLVLVEKYKLSAALDLSGMLIPSVWGAHNTNVFMQFMAINFIFHQEWKIYSYSWNSIGIHSSPLSFDDVPLTFPFLFCHSERTWEVTALVFMFFSSHLAAGGLCVVWSREGSGNSCELSIGNRNILIWWVRLRLRNPRWAVQSLHHYFSSIALDYCLYGCCESFYE